jgi:hypothetical protein
VLASCRAGVVCRWAAAHREWEGRGAFLGLLGVVTAKVGVSVNEESFGGLELGEQQRVELNCCVPHALSVSSLGRGWVSMGD